MTTINPINNIMFGVTNGSLAAAGQVGEVVSSVLLSSSAIGISGNSANVVTSISLQPGGWFILENVSLQTLGTTPSGVWAWCSTSNSVVPDNALRSGINTAVNTLSPGTAVSTPLLISNISVTTTIYLMTYLSNASGTGSACGQIYAVRFH